VQGDVEAGAKVQREARARAAHTVGIAREADITRAVGPTGLVSLARGDPPRGQDPKRSESDLQQGEHSADIERIQNGARELSVVDAARWGDLHLLAVAFVVRRRHRMTAVGAADPQPKPPTQCDVEVERDPATVEEIVGRATQKWGAKRCVEGLQCKLHARREIASLSVESKAPFRSPTGLARGCGHERRGVGIRGTLARCGAGQVQAESQNCRVVQDAPSARPLILPGSVDREAALG